MPGLFLIRDGEIIKGYRHTNAADRPDYENFVRVGLAENVV